MLLSHPSKVIRRRTTQWQFVFVTLFMANISAYFVVFSSFTAVGAAAVATAAAAVLFPVTLIMMLLN